MKKLVLATCAALLCGTILSANATTQFKIDPNAFANSPYTTFDEIGNLAAYKGTPGSVRHETTINSLDSKSVPFSTKPMNGFVANANEGLKPLNTYDHVGTAAFDFSKPGSITFVFHAKEGSGLPDKTCNIQFNQASFKTDRTIMLPSCPQS